MLDNKKIKRHMNLSSSLYAVVGLPGSGKTELINALATTGRFCTTSEDPCSRPLQIETINDPRQFSYLNQLDFFVYKATQQLQVQKEIDVRLKCGILDGCVDFDHWFFSSVLLERGWLNKEEFDSLTETYNLFRDSVPIPRLIFLTANIEVIEARIASRNRAYELVGKKEIAEAVAQVEEFRHKFSDKIVLTLDTTTSMIDYASEVSLITYECNCLSSGGLEYV